MDGRTEEPVSQVEECPAHDGADERLLPEFEKALEGHAADHRDDDPAKRLEPVGRHMDQHFGLNELISIEQSVEAFDFPGQFREFRRSFAANDVAILSGRGHLKDGYFRLQGVDPIEPRFIFGQNLQ